MICCSHPYIPSFVVVCSVIWLRGWLPIMRTCAARKHGETRTANHSKPEVGLQRLAVAPADEDAANSNRNDDLQLIPPLLGPSQDGTSLSTPAQSSKASMPQVTAPSMSLPISSALSLPSMTTAPAGLPTR